MAVSQPKFDKLMAVSELVEGDVVKLTDGSTAQFIRLKQKNFLATILTGTRLVGKDANVPINMFVEKVGHNDVTNVEDAPKKLNQSWKTLEKGDLFYIEYKGNLQIYRFSHLTNTPKIKAEHPNDPQRKITIDVPLYGGRLDELK